MMDIQKKLVLFDIDGVLADDTHRVHFALNREWDEYFDRIHLDTPLKEGIELVREWEVRPDVEVQYLTGRRIDLYEKTKQWLTQQGLPNPERITMRGFAHRAVLAKFKTGVLADSLGRDYYSTVHLYDDDPEVVRHANDTFGWGVATLTTWYVKHSEMIKSAKS